MQEWEYRVIYVTTKLGFGSANVTMWDSGSDEKPVKLASEASGVAWMRGLMHRLNTLGREGWELVSSYSMPPGGGGKIVPERHYLLKRAKPGYEAASE